MATHESKRMKTWKVQFRRTVTGIIVIAASLALWSTVARSEDAPGLSILPLPNQQFSIIVTNGSSTNQYEIQRRAAFDDFNPWNFHVAGTLGQTNFSVEMGIQQSGFFRALPCIDCDYDGFPNWLDGSPNDPAVGALTITIESPLDGSTVN